MSGEFKNTNCFFWCLLLLRHYRLGHVLLIAYSHSLLITHHSPCFLLPAYCSSLLTLKDHTIPPFKPRVHKIIQLGTEAVVDTEITKVIIVRSYLPSAG